MSLYLTFEDEDNTVEKRKIKGKKSLSIESTVKSKDQKRGRKRRFERENPKNNVMLFARKISFVKESKIIMLSILVIIDHFIIFQVILRIPAIWVKKHSRQEAPYRSTWLKFILIKNTSAKRLQNFSNRFINTDINFILREINFLWKYDFYCSCTN